VTTNAAFIDTVLEAMLPLEVTARPMFGEYGLYCHGKNFALVCDNTLFVKVTADGERVAGRIAKDSPYPGAKPAFKISPARLKSREWLVELVDDTSRALPAPKPKKRASGSR
jgi:TfoX/Sxy family transcriptional regulator of competence genes